MLLQIAQAVITAFAPVFLAGFAVAATIYTAIQLWLLFCVLAFGDKLPAPEWVEEEMEYGHGGAEWQDYQDWCDERGYDSYNEINHEEWSKTER